MGKKMALGKGIASLIEETPNQILAQSLRDEEERNNDNGGTPAKFEEVSPYLVDISQIVTNPEQPRKIFKEKELEELAQSIRENGILQPLIVSRSDDGNSFQLIAGERRLRAAKMAEVSKVPVIVKRGTDRDRMVMSIIENVQRADLNCVEEGLAYYRLMEDFNLTQEEVAKRLGKERSSIANYLRILKLPRSVVEFLQKEKISFGHAKVLASIKDRDQVMALAEIVAEEGISVRELEALSKKNLNAKGSTRRERAETSRYDSLRDALEKSTGFHFAIDGNSKGAGKITIKFSSDEEFDSIYEYLLRK